MKRSLIKQGSSTLMVSLPAKWIQKHELAKGGDVHVQQNGEDLIISPGEKTVVSQITISVEAETETNIRTMLTNAYRNGYDKIILKSPNQRVLEQAMHIVESRFIGFESTEVNENRCEFENITEPPLNQFDVILRKFFYIIKESILLTEKYLDNEKVVDQSKILSDRLQKFDNYCKRAIIKNNQIRKTEHFWSFLTLLVHGQRELYYLSQEKPIEGQISRQLLKDVSELFSTLEDMYAKKDSAQIGKIHSLQKKISTKGRTALLDSAGVLEHYAIHKILSCSRRFYQANSPLLGILMAENVSQVERVDV